MRFQRILEQLYCRPWFITPEGFSSVRRLVESRIVRAEGVDLSAFVNPREAMSIDGEGIAHIEICGVLGKGLSPLEQTCGNTDYDVAGDELEAAVEQGCRGVFLHVCSPGGACVGNSEVADLVQALPIPCVAYTDDMACSAAYNIAVSARGFYASQSATVGSIGTIIPWIDESKMWAEEGLAWDPITNAEGDLKGAMHGPSLTEAQRVSLQEYVQDAFEQFRFNVLRNRAVPPEAMRGQAFLAPRALANNLIDGICSEQDAYVKLLQLTK